MERSLLEPNKSGIVTLTILKTSEFTGKISEGIVVGDAIEVYPVDYQDGTDISSSIVANVREIVVKNGVQ